jgi:hypothetical protein
MLDRAFLICIGVLILKMAHDKYATLQTNILLPNDIMAGTFKKRI